VSAINVVDHSTTIRRQPRNHKESTQGIPRANKSPYSVLQEKKVPFIELETKTLDQPPEPMVEKLFSELKKLKLA